MAKSLKEERRLNVGFRDSNSRWIKQGDIVALEVQRNAQEVHGDWGFYEVRYRLTVPCLFYVRSSNGCIFPPGYSAMTLLSCYNEKHFLFTLNLENLRPVDAWLEVVESPRGVLVDPRDIAFCCFCDNAMVSGGQVCPKCSRQDPRKPYQIGDGREGR